MFHLIGTLIIGFVIGLVARAVHPGDDKLGFFTTSLLGIGGSFAASFVGQRVGWYRYGETAGFLGSVVGAVVLLVAYSTFVRRPAR